MVLCSPGDDDKTATSSSSSPPSSYPPILSDRVVQPTTIRVRNTITRTGRSRCNYCQNRNEIIEDTKSVSLFVQKVPPTKHIKRVSERACTGISIITTTTTTTTTTRTNKRPTKQKAHPSYTHTTCSVGVLARRRTSYVLVVHRCVNYNEKSVMSVPR